MHFLKKHPIGIVVLISFFIFTGVHLFYYEHTGSPKLLAEKLVHQKRPPKDCFLFREFDIWFRPTTYELQMRCVREYATFAKDPFACELIMPSEYGLACIGDIITNEYEDRPYDGFFPFSECALILENDPKQDWCNYLNATRNRNSQLCDPIKNEKVRMACILEFEVWNKYPELRGSSYFGKAASSSQP